MLGSNNLPEMLEQFHSLDELRKSIEDVPDYVSSELKYHHTLDHTNYQ